MPRRVMLCPLSPRDGAYHVVGGAPVPSIRERIASTMRSRFGGRGTLSMSVTPSAPSSASAPRRRFTAPFNPRTLPVRS